MDEDQSHLLDSPKRAALQDQSSHLRATLKTFERTFAEQNGRKPKQTDIKNDPSVAFKYKHYHKVQDVLAGKLAYETLSEVKPAGKLGTKTHVRQDSGIGSSPRKSQRSLQTTPKKSLLPFDLDPYDVPNSVSPRPVLMNAIGPTPHRDGKVLGLFDLLQRSGSGTSSATTPLSTRKRKIDELYRDTPARRSPLKVIQTPSQRSGKRQGDLLQFLGETPPKSSGDDTGKHSRTPQSEGKRFQLSQFFATPSTQRFLFPSEDGGTTTKETPRRDMILKQTPQRQPVVTGLDATPTYLRRSISFKDRLLSASKTASAPDLSKQSSPAKRIGPPTLRHFRSSTSNILNMTDIKSKQPRQREQQGQRHEPEHQHDDHDDDLEALRELEDGNEGPRVFVEDSQFDIEPPVSNDGDNVRAIRPYKKRGQKRTTRKSTIRPVGTLKPSAQPKFVTADGFDEDDEDDEKEDRIEETGIATDDEHDSELEGSVEEDGEPQPTGVKRKEAGSRGISKKTGKPKKQAGMINPNAQSHQNYRSVRIKGKALKANAKGAGRSKFGRGCR